MVNDKKKQREIIILTIITSIILIILWRFYLKNFFSNQQKKHENNIILEVFGQGQKNGAEISEIWQELKNFNFSEIIEQEITEKKDDGDREVEIIEKLKEKILEHEQSELPLNENELNSSIQ